MNGNARALLIVATLAAVVLAGCADNGPKKADDTFEPAFDELDLKATDSTGVLRGVVIDEAIRPIADVVVAVVGQKNGGAMTTAADGAFGFDGLEPGTYFITASKFGYGSVQSSGEVVAGVAEPALIKVLMVPDPNSGPRIQAEHLEGFIQCSVRPMILGLQCGVTGEDEVNARYEMSAIPDWIQSEMIWKSTQAAGDELSLAIRCLSNSERCPAGQLTIARSEGKSPQIATINRTHAELWALGAPDGDPLDISLFAFGRSDLDFYDEETVDDAQEPVTGKPCLDWSGVIFPAGTCVRMTGPGVIINQKVDVYTHMFYGFTPDEGWYFIADGAHALPPQ